MWKNVLTFTKKGNDSITMERREYQFGTHVIQIDDMVEFLLSAHV